MPAWTNTIAGPEPAVSQYKRAVPTATVPARPDM
jgi:hypothetical protein